MCGEKVLILLTQTALMGSPPHVRGKEIRKVGTYDGNGITPACAGKSCGLQHQSCRSRDHPRMCGEKIRMQAAHAGITGSPPHGRGKESILRTRTTKARITPACAGKSCLVLCKNSSRGDHPRMCGEKPRKFRMQQRPPGSPPHVRGKDGPVYLRVCHAGITPACAGKRYTATSLPSMFTGSPPHVRGKALRPLVTPPFCRITPACAGKSLQRGHDRR